MVVAPQDGVPSAAAALGWKESNDHDDKPRHAARVLIFGGSQGAHAINLAMVEAASRLAATGLRLAITHQTGERDLDLVRTAYQRAALPARVEAFIFEIDGEMKAADLVVCRAGATTLAELTAAGRPAILVPLPTATDDHQRKNAEVLGRAGAAIVVEERDLSGERLAAAIGGLVADGEARSRMAAAARQLARPDAAQRIADRVEQLGGRRAG
jgi:UDP-N-acetylglucosamine--N-acetylmuramyl-(pentapeptide) pyrophosphoryl-undecaprenol N-acetylglucosamine transferase